MQTVFASYAREDIEIVRACEAAYKALGVSPNYRQGCADWRSGLAPGDPRLAGEGRSFSTLLVWTRKRFASSKRGKSLTR